MRVSRMSLKSFIAFVVQKILRYFVLKEFPFYANNGWKKRKKSILRDFTWRSTWLLMLFFHVLKFWCKDFSCTRYKMFGHKGKRKLDENDAAMQDRTLRNFTTALVINLLYRLTLLHQWLREKFFHSNFLVTVIKKKLFKTRNPVWKFIPWGTQ